MERVGGGVDFREGKVSYACDRKDGILWILKDTFGAGDIFYSV